MAKKWFVYTRTIVSAEELPFKDAPTIVFVRPTDLTPQPGNPFTAVATVTGATGAPTAWLVDANGHQIPPTGAPTQSGNDWTFTFGSPTRRRKRSPSSSAPEAARSIARNDICYKEQQVPPPGVGRMEKPRPQVSRVQRVSNC